MTALTQTSSELLDELAHTTSARRLEELADLSPRCGSIAVPFLLSRLGDAVVQEHPDTEDAVCSALVQLDVMHRTGNQRFGFRARHELEPAVVALLHDLDVAIPLRYYVRPGRTP